MEIYCRKLNGVLVPDSPTDIEKLSKFKTGTPVRLTLTRPRNYDFFKKWWALIGFAYEVWEPEPHNLVGEKNIDRFRQDITILAGYYEQHIRIDGSTRVVAKSLSFASMSEEEFEDLYQKTIDVILQHVLVNYSPEELTSVMDQVLEFA